jgi:hypothetical protein
MGRIVDNERYGPFFRPQEGHYRSKRGNQKVVWPHKHSGSDRMETLKVFETFRVWPSGNQTYALIFPFGEFVLG